MNIIKKVKEKYKLSYAEIAEITGAKESTIKNSASGEVSSIIENSLQWYIKTQEANAKLNTFQHFRASLKEFLKE